MIKTMDYRTKTLMLDTMNVSEQGFWPIALDIGYSSVKGFSPNSVYAFPSYAKSLGKNPQLYGDLKTDEILYRDADTGEIWRVGHSAQEMTDDRDTGDSSKELFGRDRYFSPMFRVILRTGLALGILENSNGRYNGDPIYIETGLPPAYLEEDHGSLIDVMAGSHKFAIKTSRQPQYVNLEINIPKKRIDVMGQPEGTLMNIVMDDQANGRPNAKSFFQSDIIIFDAGFGTLDLFDVKNRKSSSKETFERFGMREVLARASLKIKEKTGIIVRSSAMQNALEAGTVLVKKRDGLNVSSRKEPFADLLEESSKEVCREAVEKIMNIYSGLFGYQYLILTGGTSAAWEEDIRRHFVDVSGLAIVAGNEYTRNAILPGQEGARLAWLKSDIIFCNVRGYYLYLVNSLRRLNSRKQGQ